MAHLILVPSGNAKGVWTGAVEYPNWNVGDTITVPLGVYNVYQKFQTDLIVEASITEIMIGVGG